MHAFLVRHALERVADAALRAASGATSALEKGVEGAEEGGKKKSWVARKKAEWRRVAGSAVAGEKKKGMGWRGGGGKYTKTCGTHILQVSI